MRLVYTVTQSEVKLGDIVTLLDGEKAQVTYFARPHKPSSHGSVSVCPVRSASSLSIQYYVSVIGAEWIEREDRAEENEWLAAQQAS